MRRGFLKNPKAIIDKPNTQPQTVQQTVQEPVLGVLEKKLPRGKVNSAALPRGYVPGKLTILDSSTNRANDRPTTSSMFMTSFPPATGALNPDGQSECIVSEELKAKILNTPGFPQPVPMPIAGPSFVVQPTAKMGTGVFATRDIKVGELIFAERPLIVTPANIGRTVNFSKEDAQIIDKETLQTIVMAEFEKKLELLIGRMTEEDRIAFKALMNYHKEDGSGPLLGIVLTNAYNVDKLEDGSGEMPPGFNLYGGVAKVGSRLNHSCSPNVTRDFSIASFSFKFTAIREIKAGEQLFVTYCWMSQTVAARRAELASYGFICDCSACVNATPETDKLRMEYKQLAQDCAKKVTECIGSPKGVVESVINPNLRLREAMIKEGLQGTQEFALVVASIYIFYSSVGMPQKAKLYAKEHSTYKVSLD